VARDRVRQRSRDGMPPGRRVTSGQNKAEEASPRRAPWSSLARRVCLISVRREGG
jgi:ribosome assembly protein YihI (activator of Der GTPase)